MTQRPERLTWMSGWRDTSWMKKSNKLDQSNYWPWQIIAPEKSAFLPSLAVRLPSWAMLQG
jgi:hypothetical protein